MPQLTLQQTLELAVQHLHAGRVGEAESLYRQILAERPEHAGALQMLAQLAFQTGRQAEAEALLRRAIALEPGNANNYSNLGSILGSQGRVDEAIESIRHALRIVPNSAEVHANLANALQNKGATDDAIAEYRRALSLRADLPEVHNNLASSLRSKGDLDGAIRHFRTSISLRPGFAETHMNLAHALKEKGLFEESVAAYEQVLRLRPNHAESHNNLGNALLEWGRVEEAKAAYQRALTLRPDLALAHYGLAVALRRGGDLDDAMRSFQRAIQLKSDYGDAYNNLGIAFQEKGEFDAAIAALTRAIAIRPDDVLSHNNLGIVYHDAGRMTDAINQYRRALEIKPKYPEAMANLALTLSEIGQVDEAIALFREALEVQPDQPLALNNLANVLKEVGRVDEALAMYRRAAQIMKEPWAASNVLFALYTHPDYGPREIFEEHVEWARKYAEPLKPKQLVFDNDPSPDRRVRLGYVSPDFNEHPVGRFLLPLLSNHDRGRFEVFCYSDVRLPDDVTGHLMGHCDVWRKTNGLSDRRLAELIRQDRIDILVDLAAHAKDNRMLVFARKPAPVQVTYLAYCGTTGLDAIDYRLTDPYLDPEIKGTVPFTGQIAPLGEHFYSEESVRLPRTYWCYVASRYAPPVGPLPARDAGYITFGCLNSFTKVSKASLETWCELLKGVPGSRLLLHARQGGHRSRVEEQLAAHGIDPQQLEFIPRVGADQYFQQYNRIDIALDPFPYPGGTTTCDALWMGVPVVSLAGQTAISRGGLSILSNVGLPELVARSRQEYVEIAAALAADVERLAQLRTGLRARMQASPLMDAPQFARDVEAAFRGMWREWSQ